MARPLDVRLQAAQEAYDEALRLQEVGSYAEATVRGQRALELREAVLGGSHLEVASCLNLLGGLHRIQGDFDRAESLLQRGLTLREAVLGRNHADVALSLNGLANLYRERGLYARAEPLYARTISILESALVDPYAKKGLNDWVGLLIPHTLALEGVTGIFHVVRDDPAALDNLNLQNLYDPAEPLYQRALDMAKGSIGKHHPTVASTLNELGLLYAAQGLYVRAEPLLQRALDIRETALGQHHPTVAASLNNLAILHASQGLYVRAEPLLQRALDIRLAALGQEHPDVAASLNNLAILYANQGLYGRAEALHVRALSLAEAALGKSHPTVATSLSSLANLYVKQELYALAEPLYQRALSIRQAAFGQHHPTVAASLTSLANVYRQRGAYGSAEPLYQFALTLREAALGKHHPDVADSLNNLAVLYANQGLHDRAEPLYARALTLREATLGENHPEVAALLNNLALLRLSQHRLDAAIPLLTRAFAISEQRLRQEALDFSEARLASFLQLLRADEERLHALLRARQDDDRVRHLALGAALLLKGRSVAQTADISRAVYRSLGEEGRDTFERLRGLRTQLASLSLQGPGPLPLKEFQQQLKALAEQGDALEADLARRSAPLRELAGLPPLADIVGQVAEALPEDAALIELISYQDRPLVPGPGAPKPHQRYLAMVLLPDARILSLDLGPAGPIDSAASRLRDALANRDAAFQAQAQALYTLVFQPLLPLLGTLRHLFLSPDGPLALVPFAALHDGERFLVEDFDFVYLTSGRDLLPRPQQSAPASSVVVLADPDFNAPPRPPASSLARAPARVMRSSSLKRFFSALSEEGTQRDWDFVPLPGSRQEARAIQRLLPHAQLYLGAEATKERLLHLPPPGILHVATHGFFLEDEPAPPAARAVAHIGALGDGARGASPPDPLLRSGLVLAGASAPAPAGSGPAASQVDSTLVTALELAGLDLWGTQLVVLSACDTGRGDVKLGQGVYGLRRAFLVAGAETVVMSLWKVNDETTRELMEAYYHQLLAGQGRAAALREAMRKLSQAQPHPHYWAPFIAMGRETPLRLFTSSFLRYRGLAADSENAR